MNKKLLTLAATLTFVCSCSNSSNISSSNKSTDSKVAKIIVLAGQSNMEGNSWLSELPRHYTTQQINVWKEGWTSSKIMYNNSWGNYTSLGGFVKPKLGIGCDASHFGPEVGIAETIDSHNLNETIYLVKFAWGGSNLYNQWHSPSSGTTGALYANFITFVDGAITLLKGRGLTPQIHALCWMQGESDSDSTSHANEYYEHLSNLVTDFRTEFDEYACQSGIGFIDAFISNSIKWPFYQTINQAKQQFANEDILNVVIDTISLNFPYSTEPTYSPDLYHYDSNGMIELGREFGKKLFEYFLW